MHKRTNAIFLLSLSVWIVGATAALAAPTSSQDTDVAATTSQAAVVDSEKLTDGNAGGHSTSNDGTYERAIVKTVKTVNQQTGGTLTQQRAIEAEFLSGPLKGQTRTLLSDSSGSPFEIVPRPGDKIVVLLQPDPSGGEPTPYFESFDRRGAMYWLIALFVLTMVLLAGWQGLKIAFSILISVLLIGVILIPSFLKGINPIPVAFLLSAILATISSGLSIGWNRKTFVTVIGTLGGVVIAYLISTIFANWSHLSGLSTDEDRLFFDKNPLLNPQGLLFAGIIIASLGVVEDVAVSIASGVMEVRQANMRLGFKELFRSGMVIGRDHMGALANTLVFAYVGGSLSALLLYTQFGGSWAKFMNFDVVVDEIIRSLAGTIGLVFTVPITALLAAWIALRIKQSKNPIAKASAWHAEETHAQE